ncbi:hypothetical protein GGTG_12622 [Gaeumannomyces tritici R3-111a-1]|uniref:Uncharacterized protein n=1 Tax=Gaeumannomyces tritici (strain R3-111a-1) TaxID=644352 RepID=J3PGJ4_GAET3|nr:hypothetical protein GGTG_12622 [Gaeumannomyces tritici R3-111a-1]EJT69739.1 hypothetical protein GGTG_12622 [Gaeumannomyces tritici R3-111a-1]
MSDSASTVATKQRLLRLSIKYPAEGGKTDAIDYIFIEVVPDMAATTQWRADTLHVYRAVRNPELWETGVVVLAETDNILPPGAERHSWGQGQSPSWCENREMPWEPILTAYASSRADGNKVKADKWVDETIKALNVRFAWWELDRIDIPYREVRPAATAPPAPPSSARAPPPAGPYEFHFFAYLRKEHMIYERK